MNIYSSIRCRAADSAYNVMSAGTAPCTVSANIASALALVCSIDVTSLEVDDVVRHACTVHWQRLSTTGRYSNVTSSSGRYSMWKMERLAVTSDRDDSDVNVLQIDTVQYDDFTRFAVCL